MLTNFYPISTKHLPVNRFRPLSQFIRAYKGVGSWSLKDHAKPTQASQYNHLGPWAEDFNQQLVGHQATIITDNNDIRIHQSGELGQLRLYGDMGLLRGGEIDIYFYTENWRTINHRQVSITGCLVCHDDSHHQSWQLTSPQLKITSTNPKLSISIPAQHQPATQQAITSQVEAHELRQMWASLTHIHQFYDMLSLFKLGLLDAIKLMQDQWTQPISSCQLVKFLQQCQTQNLNTKILAGNRGILHVLKSPILHLDQELKQLTIGGHNYRCKLNLPAIKQVWLVKRAVKQGIVHSLEAFDCHDRLIVQVQEQRSENQPESALWTHCLGRQGMIPMV